MILLFLDDRNVLTLLECTINYGYLEKANITFHLQDNSLKQSVSRGALEYGRKCGQMPPILSTRELKYFSIKSSIFRLHSEPYSVLNYNLYSSF